MFRLVRGLEHCQAGDQPRLQHRSEQVQGWSNHYIRENQCLYMRNCDGFITPRHLVEAICTCGSPLGGSLVSRPKVLRNMFICITGRQSTRVGPVRLVSVVLQILSRQEMQVFHFDIYTHFSPLIYIPTYIHANTSIHRYIHTECTNIHVHYYIENTSNPIHAILY